LTTKWTHLLAFRPWPRRAPQPWVAAVCRRWRVVECADPSLASIQRHSL